MPLDGDSQAGIGRTQPPPMMFVFYIHVEDLQIDNKLSQSQSPDVDLRLRGPRLRKLRLFRLPIDVGASCPTYRHRRLECKIFRIWATDIVNFPSITSQL